MCQTLMGVDQSQSLPSLGLLQTSGLPSPGKFMLLEAKHVCTAVEMWSCPLMRSNFFLKEPYWIPC